MNRKRGQAAFEFLTTYGWAFMVILIMIGALSYFGILNPSKLLPNRCNFQSEIICEDYQLDGVNDQVNIQLRHNMGETILLQSINCTFDNGDSVSVSTFTPSGTDWRPKQTKEATCDAAVAGFGNQVLFSGQKEKVDITVTYKLDTGGYDHYAEGEVYANVQ